MRKAPGGKHTSPSGERAGKAASARGALWLPGSGTGCLQSGTTPPFTMWGPGSGLALARLPLLPQQLPLLPSPSALCLSTCVTCTSLPGLLVTREESNHTVSHHGVFHPPLPDSPNHAGSSPCVATTLATTIPGLAHGEAPSPVPHQSAREGRGGVSNTRTHHYCPVRIFPQLSPALSRKSEPHQSPHLSPVSACPHLARSSLQPTLSRRGPSACPFRGLEFCPAPLAVGSSPPALYSFKTPFLTTRSRRFLPFSLPLLPARFPTGMPLGRHHSFQKI